MKVRTFLNPVPASQWARGFAPDVRDEIAAEYERSTGRSYKKFLENQELCIRAVKPGHVAFLQRKGIAA